MRFDSKCVYRTVVSLFANIYFQEVFLRTLTFNKCYKSNVIYVCTVSNVMCVLCQMLYLCLYTVLTVIYVCTVMDVISVY